MITLSNKLREARKKKDGDVVSTSRETVSNHSTIRDKLLTKEIADIKKHINANCQIAFPDPDKLHTFMVTIQPEEGFWKGGIFKFNVLVPEEYNIKPPIVKCNTQLWHPNISLDGSVCLSILRDHSLDGSGWAPTRSIKDVIWGLNSIFTDLVDFDDPLNDDAANEYKNDQRSFRRTVESYLYRYARS